MASDKRYDDELWRSDGTRKGTRLVRNIGRGRATSQPQQLTAVGRSLFFTAKEPTREGTVEGRTETVQAGQGEVQEEVGP